MTAVAFLLLVLLSLSMVFLLCFVLSLCSEALGLAVWLGLEVIEFLLAPSRLADHATQYTR